MFYIRYNYYYFYQFMILAENLQNSKSKETHSMSGKHICLNTFSSLAVA
jgi:hypothetical protein